MPSGRVHDAIVVLTAGAAVPTIALTWQNPDWTAVSIGIGSYLFSGIALSPDLDINSRAYRRWGIFRLFWIPYRIIVPHRHWLSHSWVLGPTLRALYFFAMLYLLVRWGIAAVDRWIVSIDENEILRHLERELRIAIHTHFTWTNATLIGLIAGGIVHSLTDAFVTWFRKTL